MREMAQARFAGRDRRGGAAHVAQHEGGKQRETGERDRDERHHVVDDLGARLLRRPGEARDALPSRAGRGHRQGRRAAPASCSIMRRFGKSQLRGDAGERCVVDEFDRHDDRRGGVDGSAISSSGADGDRRDDGRLAHARCGSPPLADARRLRSGSAGRGGWRRAGRGSRPRMKSSTRREIGARAGKPLRCRPRDCRAASRSAGRCHRR